MIALVSRLFALILLAHAVPKADRSGAKCDLYRIDARSPDTAEAFAKRFRRKVAVLIEGLMDSDWPTRDWTFNDWQRELSNVTLPRRRLRSVAFGGAVHAAQELPGNQLLNASLRTEGDEWMVFSTAANDAVVERLRELGAFKQQHMLARISKQPVLSIGTAGEGLAFHQHEEAWLGLLHGSKQWYLRRPNDRPPRAHMHKRVAEQSLANEPSTIRCRQRAGEILYFPEMWWHATYNIEDNDDNLTVGVGGLGEVGDRTIQMVLEGDVQGLQAILERDGSAFMQWIAEEGMEPGARSGHARVVEWLLENGGKARSHDEKEGMQVVHRAAQEGHISVVATLLDRKANVNAKTENVGSAGQKNIGGGGRTPMHLAASQGHTEMLAWLMERKGNINAKENQGLQALHIAAHSGHADAVSWLKDRDDAAKRPANPKASLTVAAAAGGHAAMLSLLQKDKTVMKDKDEKAEQKLCFESAIANGHGEVVKFLLDQGCLQHMHFDENMPVHWAARDGHVDVLEVLLEHGAHDVHTPDTGNASPLHYSAIQGHKGVAKMLLQRRASVDAIDADSRGAAHLAAMNGHTSVLSILLKQRANVNSRDNRGIQPLHMAAKDNQINTMMWLSRQGAEPLESHVASKFGHAQVMELVMEKDEL